jgi:hypothetical protein
MLVVNSDDIWYVDPAVVVVMAWLPDSAEDVTGREVAAASLGGVF